MALTLNSANLVIVPDSEDVLGSHYRTWQYDFTPPTTSYSGGYSYTPATFGLTVIRGVYLVAQNSASAGYGLTNQLTTFPSGLSGGILRFFQGATEASGNISTYGFRLLVEGE